MSANKITNRQAICDVLTKNAATDRDIVVLCSDSRGSGSVTEFAERFPEQFVEVGIAEQNLVTVAAGLAHCGKKTFAVSPACFLSTRSYEQAKVDVAYGRANVTLIGISGGVSYGALGMTHHSLQDIAAMAALPDMRVFLPSDRFQTAAIIEQLLRDDLPAYIRVSRNASEDIYTKNTAFELNKAKILAEGSDIAIFACGEMVYPALKAAELLKKDEISATVVDLFSAKPLDRDTVVEQAKRVRAVLTVEEHSPCGGLCSMVSQVICAECPKRAAGLSLPDGHIVPGSQQEAFEYYGLTAQGICSRAKEVLR